MINPLEGEGNKPKGEQLSSPLFMAFGAVYVDDCGCGKILLNILKDFTAETLKIST